MQKKGKIESVKYQVGICDDEEYQIKLNGLYLKEIASKNNWDMECRGFKSGTHVLKYLETKHLDLLFLDIDLGEESGIHIAAQIAAKYPKVVVIFVTGHREFTGEAFEVEAMGYLVKPYDIKKMESILKKARLQVSAIQKQDDNKEIVITDENIKKKVKVQEILYIERQLSKTIIYTEKQSYKVYETISSLYDRLGDGFLRINQGEVISLKEISEIRGNLVILKNGNEMSIGRTYRQEVIAKYFGPNGTSK